MAKDPSGRAGAAGAVSRGVERRARMSQPLGAKHGGIALLFQWK